MPSDDRDEVVKAALEQGFTLEQVNRWPVNVIRAQLAGRKAQDRRKHRSGAVSRGESRQRLSDGPDPLRPRVPSSVPSIMPRTTEEEEGEALGAGSQSLAPGEDGPDDDTATVVDLSFVAQSQSPSEEKFQRFKSLQRDKRELLAAMETNAQLLNASRHQMEVDDVQAFERDLQETRHKIDLMSQEMRGIHQWLTEMYRERKAMYDSIMQHAVDVNGGLVTHFRTKNQSLERHLAEMERLAR